ncbi:MAG: OmpA family protein [Actinomycetota bacterium]
MTQYRSPSDDPIAASISTMEHEDLGQMVQILVALHKHRRLGRSSEEIAKHMAPSFPEAPGGGPWDGPTVDRVMAIVDSIRAERREEGEADVPGSRAVAEMLEAAPAATPASVGLGSRLVLPPTADASEPDREGSERRWLVVAGAAAAALVVGAGSVLVLQSLGADGGDTAVGDGAGPTTTAAASAVAALDGVSPPSTLVPPDPADMLAIRIEPPAADGAEPGALTAATATIKADGLLHLEGAFQTQAQADAFVDGAAEVFGRENIIEAYVVDADAPTPSVSDVSLDKPVLFETGSAVIDPTYIPFLEACGDVLKLNPNIVMSVSGFTDSVGDAEFNLELSQRRAEAIINFYRDLDIGDDQLLAVGFGESEFVANNESEDGRSQNRRAMLELLDVIDDDAQDGDE